MIQKYTLDRNLPILSLLNMFSPMIDEQKTVFLNIFRTYVVSKTISEQELIFQYYTVEHNEFLDTISNKLYNTPYLWWVIPIFNNIINPFEDINEGDVLKILRYEYTYIILDNIARIGKL